MKRKDEFRDIYQSNSHDLEKDFTPQVAKELVEQRRRDLQRTHTRSIALGGLAVVIVITIISLVAHNVLTERNISTKVPTKERVFIPRHTLPLDAIWVLDYRLSSEQMNLDVELGEKSLSVDWVKKAAYHIIMGEQAMALQEMDAALEHFNYVVKIYPDIEGLHRAMGILYIYHEEYEKAAKHLEKALSEKETFSVVNNLGTAYIGIEKYDQAKKHLLRALELQPEDPICHKNLALLYRKKENVDSAIFHFEKYIDLKPNDVDTLQTYALYLTQQEKWEQAAEFLTELTQEVTDVAPIFFLLAQVQVQNGKEALALDALQRGIQLVDPNLALAWMSREEFLGVRDSSDFKSLITELEIATDSLNHIQ